MSKKPVKENNTFWVSYSDLSTGLMIVFLLVMLIMIMAQKQNGEIKAQRVSELTAKLELSLGQKSRLSEAINTAFVEDPSVQADPVTAQISIDQSALQFKENQAELQPAGKTFIQKFTPKYICSLWMYEVQKCRETSLDCTRPDPELPGSVRRIHVTGHADMLGIYSNNHALSSLRAEEVTKEMLFVLSSSNPVIAELPEICKFNPDYLRAYAEERLWAIGAGETQHCTKELNESANAQTSQRCDSLYATDDSYRRVNVGLEVTGDDMTGLLADMVALRKEIGIAIGQEFQDPLAKRIDILARTVSNECWKDPSKYHGCKTFVRDCLAGRQVEYCGTLIDTHRTNIKMFNMIRRICRYEDLKNCPPTIKDD